VQKTDQRILTLLQGEEPEGTPLWLMRQAGRYLPEYREIRSKAKDFISFCLTPSLASEATLQPLRRYDLDAAILFADILLVPFAMNQKVSFETGEGPRLEPLTELGRLKWDVARLDPVFETIERVKGSLSKQHSFFGFAGGLWTVACYMLEGQGQTGFPRAIQVAQDAPLYLKDLQESLLHATLEYLGRQIEAGVNIIQLFESHAGLLKDEAFDAFIIEPTRKLVAALKKEYPEIPVIGFPRGASEEDYLAYASQTGVDAVGLDQHMDVDFAKEKIIPHMPVQGNLDPCLLLRGGDEMKDAARLLLDNLGGHFIFNLGHGVLKETPPEHVADLVSLIREWSR